eukprot:8212741-Heterocapsa_arctica.AAC.1
MSHAEQAWAAKYTMLKCGLLAANCPGHIMDIANSPRACRRSTLMVRSAALLAGFPLRSSVPSQTDLKMSGKVKRPCATSTRMYEATEAQGSPERR